ATQQPMGWCDTKPRHVGSRFQLVDERFVSVRSIVQDSAAGVTQKNRCTNIFGVIMEFQRLHIEPAPKEAIAQIQLVERGVAIQEEKFHLSGQRWVGSK